MAPGKTGKKVLKVVLGIAFGIYCLGAACFTPYYNWQYAQKHGLASWLLLGEVVATAKACAWPYFVLSSNESSQQRLDHYVKSKIACDEAMLIVRKRGDALQLTADETAEVAGLLRLAISEGELVELSYLQSVHIEFPTKYREGYLKALRMQADGLESGKSWLTLGGGYGYNEFAEWMKDNQRNLRFP